jgi:L-lactate dehydrogenase complex protein LldE
VRVGLFVPCYIDQLYPDVGFASVELLEAYGVHVDVPAEQVCCGQVLTNRGAVAAARPLAAQFEAAFGAFDYVVCPSGSCTAALHHQAGWFRTPGAREGAAGRVYELCQFLVQVLGVEGSALSAPAVRFPYKVALHESCHGLRELGLGRPSELGWTARAAASPARRLLEQLSEVTLIEPERTDECCGFGGSFSVVEPQVSARMGNDRLGDFERAGAEVVTSADMSCLMHLSGL